MPGAHSVSLSSGLKALQMACNSLLFVWDAGIFAFAVVLGVTAGQIVRFVVDFTRIVFAWVKTSSLSLALL